MRIFKLCVLLLIAISPLISDVYLMDESFESGMPSGWTTGDGNNDGVVWTTGQTSGLNNYWEPSASNYAYFDDADASPSAPAGDDTLYSPIIYVDTLAPLADLRLYFAYGIYSDYGNPPIILIFAYRIKTNGTWSAWQEETSFTPNSVGGYYFSVPRNNTEAVQFAWIFRETDGVGNGGAAGIDNVELYIRYTSLHPVSTTWNDGGDLIPNEEGDGTLFSPVQLTYNLVNVGDTSYDDIKLVYVCNDISGTVCQNIQNAGQDTINLGILSTYDTVQAMLNIVLSPYAGMDTFEIGFDVYEGSYSRHSVVKRYVLKPQYIDTTPLYTFYDNTDDHYSEAPQFAWREINPNAGGDGTLLPLIQGNDSSYNFLYLPHPFRYAGVLYDTITVSQHGYIMFGMRNAYYDDNFIGFPTNLPYPMFAALWTMMDFDGTYGSPHGIYTHVSDSEVVIEYSGISSTYDSDTTSFEIILRYNDLSNPQDDELLIQYLLGPTERLSEATVGYQNADGDIGYNLVYKGRLSPSTYALGPMRAIRFVPVPTTPPNFSLNGFFWNDGEDSSPDAGGDNGVDYAVSIHNAGGPGYNVMAEISCSDGGSGVCSYITFHNTRDTVTTIEESTDTTFHFNLDLAQGAPENASFYLITKIYYNSDSITFTDTLTVAPSGGGVPHGVGYYALQNGDNQYEIPDVSFVELNPAYGGDGTLLTLSSGSGDDGYGSISLPESFSYMQSNYNTIWVSTNGWASFGDDPGTSAFLNYELPHNDGISSMLAVLWDDLRFTDYGGNDGIYYKYDFGHNRMIIEWSRALQYSNDNDTVSFELILYYGNTDTKDAFAFIYPVDIPGVFINTATVGIENETEDSALLVLYNGTYGDGFDPLVAGHFIYFTRELVGMNEHRNQNVHSGVLTYDFTRELLAVNNITDKNITLTIYDALGRRVESHIIPSHRTCKLRLSSLPKGVYFVKLGGSLRRTKKIIIR